MADDATTTTTDDPDAATATETTTDDTATTEDLGDAGKRALQDERRKVKDAVNRAKAAEAELVKLRKTTMTDTERAAAEAEQRGREAATAEFAQRLVRAEFRAIAGDRVKDLDATLDDLNLAKFIGDDGEPDDKAIRRAVARLAPAATAEDTTRRPGPRPDLSQGGSRNQTALNSDALTDTLARAVGL